MNPVKFSYGLLANYEGLQTKDKNTVYFITDKPYIFYNGVRYGSVISDFKTVTSVEVTGNNTITITYSDDTPQSTFVLQEASKTVAGLMSASDKSKLDNLDTTLESNLMYNSELEDSLATVQAHGGIPVGTTVADLKKKTLSQIFDDVIFPTVNPTYDAPTASLSLKNTSTTPIVQEVGTTGSTVPTESSFNTSFNPGAIKIAGVKKLDRAGSLKPAPDSFIYINGSTSNKTLPTTIAEGATTYKYRAAYNEGPQPLDSKGNNYETPLAAGYVESGTVTVTGVYPYFANKANEADNKLPLSTSTTINVVYAAEGPNKHYFKLPAKYTLTKVELLNTLSGKYENFGVDKFDVTTESIQVQGNSVDYKKYTRNDSGFKGTSTFNITFSK